MKSECSTPVASAMLPPPVGLPRLLPQGDHVARDTGRERCTTWHGPRRCRFRRVGLPDPRLGDIKVINTAFRWCDGEIRRSIVLNCNHIASRDFLALPTTGILQDWVDNWLRCVRPTGTKLTRCFSLGRYPIDTGIFISGGLDGYVKVWDTNSLEVALEFDMKEKVSAVQGPAN